MSTITLQSIPATDIRPGDLIDTANAYSPGPVIRVRTTLVIDLDTIYVARHESGALVQGWYRFRADQRVDLYARP